MEAEEKPTPDNKKTGPDADRVKLEGDWEDAVKKALKKKKPPEGWPQEDEQSGESVSDSGSDRD